MDRSVERDACTMLNNVKQIDTQYWNSEFTYVDVNVHAHIHYRR